MVRVQIKLLNAVQALEYFTTHEWTFLDKNVHHLRSKLSESDRKVFDFDVRAIKWVPYIEKYVKGIRTFILKEDEKNIPTAKQHLRRMFLLHSLTQALVLFGFWKILVGNSSIARKISYSIISFVLVAITKLTSLFSN